MKRTLLGLLLLTSGCAPGVFYSDEAIDNDGDGVLPGDGDCDDGDPAVAFGFDEVCDGVDNDCDGLIDGLDEELRDNDGDGADDCVDCDDNERSRAPDADEICDGLDNDCDEILPADESDADGDGVSSCEGDCDDSEAGVLPGAVELCDGWDNDCDEFLDEPTSSSLETRVGVAGPGGDVLVWMVTGDTLGTPSGLSIPVGAGVVGGVVAVDLDGDGATEWLRQQIDPAAADADEVVGLPRECEGGWGDAASHDITLGGESRLVAGGDLDGDGFGDVVTVVLAGVNAGNAIVQLGDGFGGYLVRPSDVNIPAVAVGDRWAVSPRLMDLNGDGDVDMLVCGDEALGPRCRLHTGQGDGSFGGGVVRAEPPLSFDSMDVGDGNGDGVLDLFVGLRGDDGGAVYMLQGDGTGRFGEAIEILNVSSVDGAGEGVLAVVPGTPTVGLALLWDPDSDSAVRELAVARTDGTSWSLGPSETFSAVVGAPGLPESLVISP